MPGSKPSGTAAQWRHSGGTDWPLGGTVAAQSGGTAAQLGGSCATGGTTWRQLCHWRHGGTAWRHGGTAWRHGGTAAQPGGTAAQPGGTAARRHGGTVAAQWRHNLAARRHNLRHACHWRHRLAARRHGGTAAQWRQSHPCADLPYVLLPPPRFFLILFLIHRSPDFSISATPLCIPRLH
eukprot:gene15721-biopygen6701